MSDLTPWARNALTTTELRLVRDARISISGKSPRGPWIAWGPAFLRDSEGDNDKATRWVSSIHAAVNRAAGTELLKGEK